jgi:glycosyltransferase involved in cell wall biosynthesis
MRILMLHDRYQVRGGEECSTAADVALLREGGHSVELWEQDNTEIHQIGRLRTAARTIWSSAAHHAVTNKLRTDRFDLLHVQNFFPLWSPSVYWAAQSLGVPVVQTLHNYRLTCVNGLLFRRDAACEKCLGRAVPWSGIWHGCYRGSRAASSVVAGMIGWHHLVGSWERKVGAYISVSDFARRKFLAAGLPADKIVVRPNFLHPIPSAGAGRGGYALYAGRLTAEKGIPTLLQAWKAASPVLPLVIVGDGPLRDTVISAAEPGKIEYRGSKSLEEVLELMGKAEFLVFPSQCYETMGRTVMEALAKGTPVVVSDAGAAAEMVVNGETGFHFAAGSVAALRDRIQWCWENRQQLHNMRAAARAGFGTKYTPERSAALLMQAYELAGAPTIPMTRSCAAAE